jgi:hypothetical protein
MGGALTQLAAYGAQDVYLTGNPQMAYRREGFTNSFTLKHAAIFASAVSLAIIFFYMKRNRLPLVLLVAIGVIFTLIQW